ncbi:MAG: hypothetical protein LBP59_13060 [Planctomycetaceae bacterium]|jgi:hypothetical protein|nr:hypothetical protein [Planctomycetaceae bacterium]
MKNRINFLVTIFFGLLLTICGCNNGLTPVSGNVKFSDGATLDRGTIIFSGDKYQFYGVIQSNGEFHLNGLNGKKGIPIGSYNILIGATDDNDQSIISDAKPKPDVFNVQKGQKNICNIIVERTEPAK